MKLEETSLSYFICEVLGIEQDTPEFLDVMRSTIEYIVCHTSIKTYHAQLNASVDFSQLEFTPPGFRLKLIESGYVLKNINYFAANILLSRGLSRTDISAMSKRFGIKTCDSRYIVKSVNTNSKKLAREFVRSKGLTKRDYSVDSYGELTSELSGLLESLHSYTRKHVWRKLKFVTKYENIASSDFESELLCQVVRAFYQSKPNKMTPLHQLNYLKRTVTSRVNNIIDCFTAQKRQRLMNVGEDNGKNAKFVLRTTAESQLPLDNSGETQSLDSLGENDIWDTHSDSQEFKLTLERMIERTKGTKRGVLIKVFSGQDVKLFTEFLRKKRILRSDAKTCQDIVATRPTEEVCDLLVECLGISKGAVRKALKEYTHDLGL